MINDMIVFSADARYKYACDILEDNGYTVRLCTDVTEYDGEETVVFPMPVTKDGLTFYLPKAAKTRYIIPFIDSLSPSCRLFCGAANNGFAELCKFYGFKITDYYDEEFKCVNSSLTADLAVDIYGKKNALIIGYGRIGKRLAQICDNAVVCARSSKDIDDIKQKYTFVSYDDLQNEISKFDIIYNTVPVNVISADTAVKITGKYVELASLPGGVPKDVISDIDYYEERGLPAKANPKAAGAILADGIMRKLTEGGF